MTDDEKRIAIALHCGWKYRCADKLDEALGRLYPDQMADPSSGEVEVIPDYPEDLNACHEMEKVLTVNQCFNYQTHLRVIMLDWLALGEGKAACESFIWNATARQRTDAFLLAIGRSE